MKRRLTWLALAVGGLVVLVLVGGAIYQTVCESRDLARFPPPGKLVEVDGRPMHIHCQGRGSPTVVLEQGLGGVSASWREIHRQMARITRVCGYDRAGLGYSEPRGRPLRAPRVAALLNKLLRAAEVDDDLVLVGWSAGGIYIRAFYRQHPGRVRAMLFVESSHEQQRQRLPAPPRTGNQSSMKIARYLAPFGLLRLSGMVENRFASFPGPEELKARLIALYQQSHVVGALLRESESFDADIDADPPPPLGDLPLIVLTAGKSPETDAGEMSAEMLEYLRKQREVHLELQRELTALSTRGRQILATESGHAVHADQPELVVESVRELVELVRNERR